MKKKGVMIQSSIVGLIIIILIAAVLFLVISNAKLKTTGEQQICQFSALTRSIISKVGLKTSLACQTHYYCLTLGAGCDMENYEKVVVKDDEDIKEFIAEKLQDCWNIGKGELDFLEGGQKSCVICSVFTFDDAIAKKGSIEFAKPSETELSKALKKELEGIPLSKLNMQQSGLELVDDEGDKIDYAIAYSYKRINIWKSVWVSVGVALGEGTLIGITYLFPPSGVVTIPAMKILAAGGLSYWAFDMGGQAYMVGESCITKPCHSILLVPYTSNALRELCSTFEGTS